MRNGGMVDSKLAGDRGHRGKGDCCCGSNLGDYALEIGQRNGIEDPGIPESPGFERAESSERRRQLGGDRPLRHPRVRRCCGRHDRTDRVAG